MINRLETPFYTLCEAMNEIQSYGLEIIFNHGPVTDLLAKQHHSTVTPRGEENNE